MERKNKKKKTSGKTESNNNKKTKTINKKSTSTKTKNISKEKNNNNETKKNDNQLEFDNSKINKKLYFSYDSRLLFNYILVFIFMILGALLLKESLKKQDGLNITYKENSNLDYKVYLKQNDFYETNYLGKDMIYVASLIDKIDVNFNYRFKINKLSNVKFKYNIIGKLVIQDKNEKNTFFEKEYVLLNPKSDTVNSLEHIINENVNIDYDYYNNLANKFRNNYGVETVSNLIVYLNINESNEKEDFDLDNASVMSLKIPLSERAINISMNYQEVNKMNKIIREESIVIKKKNYLVYSIISFLFSIYFIIRYTRLLSLVFEKRSKYDKYINKILKEYDRLIVETTTEPDINNNKVIKVSRFEELLDVRDNLQLPIKYYVVNKHMKCNFYINNNKELYLLVIKESDVGDK